MVDKKNSGVKTEHALPLSKLSGMEGLGGLDHIEMPPPGSYQHQVETSPAVTPEELTAAVKIVREAVHNSPDITDDQNTRLQAALSKLMPSDEAITAPGAIEEIPRDPNIPALLRPADILGEWDAKAEALYNALQNGHPIGPLSGFGKIDCEMCGAFPPGVHIVHGDPGAGKTAFALQIACSCLCPALYVTCEMGPIELLRRITSRVTNTFLGKFKTGELPPDYAKSLVRRAVQAVPNLYIADATRSQATTKWILDTARMIRQQTESEYFLLLIDSVHSWADSMTGAEGEYEALNKALSAMRLLGAELACPVVGIAERNRAAQGKGGMGASAGSRKFEYGGETVMELSRSEEESVLGERDAKLKFAKNRHGTPGNTISLVFNGALQSFREA